LANNQIFVLDYLDDAEGFDSGFCWFMFGIGDGSLDHGGQFGGTLFWNGFNDYFGYYFDLYVEVNNRAYCKYL
jgi:hypothetical protein